VTRVLVDARALGDDSSYRGIGTYLRNVLAGVAHTPGLSTAALVTAGTNLPEGVEAVRVRRHAPGRFSRLEHDLLLPWDLRRVDADVVHSPAQDPPARSPAPWVQTLHDVVPLTAGSSAERRRWKRAAARIRRADAVIAVSTWSARTAAEALGVDTAKLHVVHHGVSDWFQPAARESAEAPYVLLVGEYDPRKRHALAFEVIGSIAARGLPHRLVVAGRIAPWYDERMRELVSGSAEPDRITLTGYVDDDTLLHLYQQADALLVTSSAEGFGFPALEAMACATPVVAFANSATSEVVGQGGALVDDGDVNAMCEALARLLVDRHAWADASASALQSAGRFTWSECVRQHVEIFTAVAA
jgi:glycosyltransferase involved in cell wall biosynthesis